LNVEGRATALDGFLIEARDLPFDWAETNCALWVADWIEYCSGIDPAASLRGRAHNTDEWKALLDAEGGFIPIIGHIMDCYGFERTQSPACGDVAIVTVPIAMCDRMPVVGTVAAICLAPASRSLWPGFVVRSLRGLHFERFSFVTAWRMIWRREMTTH
jgi:hypothetical protein